MKDFRWKARIRNPELYSHPPPPLYAHAWLWWKTDFIIPDFDAK
jgi:hypothetical protein